MSDDYAQKPAQEYGTTRVSSSTGNSIQNLLVTLSVAGLWLLVTAAAPEGGYGASDYEYPSTYWDKYRKYAVSVGAAGLGLGLIALLMTRFKPDMSDKKMLSIKSTDVSVLGAFSIFFVLWWGVGAGVCTFKSPFAPDPATNPAGNGYFSVWTGFLASLLLLSETMSIGDAKSLKGRAAGLFFAAVMLLIATIKYVDPNDGVEFPSATAATDDIAIFSMASAAATILITILIIFADMKESAIQTIIPILVLLWAATAGVLTFRSGSPFIGMNNGYFASWFGFFMAAQMTGSASGPLNSKIFQILALSAVVVLSAYFYMEDGQVSDVTNPVVDGDTQMVFQDNIVPDRQAYMIAVGALAGFLALFHYWCSVFKPALLETVLFNVSDSPVSMRRAMAIFLVPWVAAGAIVGTFFVTGGGLFLNPSMTANGYFSIWLLLIACLAHLGSEAESAVENARAVANADALSSSMFAFLFASVIVLGWLLQAGGVIQAGRSADVDGMFGEYVYSLVLVCISAFVALYHLVLKEPLPLVNKIATPLLALGWLGAAGVLTFRDSAGFSVAGNGFFAVYVGLFLSFALVGKVHLSPARDDPPAAHAVISDAA